MYIYKSNTWVLCLGFVCTWVLVDRLLDSVIVILRFREMYGVPTTVGFLVSVVEKDHPLLKRPTVLEPLRLRSSRLS